MLKWSFGSSGSQNSAAIRVLFFHFLLSLIIRSCSSLECTASFPGYRLRAGSTSPVRRRDSDHRYNSDFDHLRSLARSREVGAARDAGRFRDYSPPYARGRGSGRPFGRGPDGPDFGPGLFRGEGMSRNNPNVRPREGDWYCLDPL